MARDQSIVDFNLAALQLAKRLDILLISFYDVRHGVINCSTLGFSASGSLEGTVKVRVRWTGGGTAPNHVWLAVDSSATWTGDSGSSDNGQGDPEVALQPGPGKRSEGIHVIRKPYSGQPIIFELAFSSTMQCSTIMTTYAVQATLNVTVTDRSAMLARGDGGTATLEDGTYTAHTLLSWSGTHDGVNYDELPDGGPGITSQILTGTASGSWKNKPFTNPQTQQTYTTKDLTVNWGGSTTGTVSLTPPNPLEVFISTYQGNMPQFDPEGTSPKEETWTYKVKDNQDSMTLDLKWKWIAHYVVENWEGYTPTTPTKHIIPGPTLTSQHLTFQNPSYTYTWNSHWTQTVTTSWSIPTPSPHITFIIEKHHISVAFFREAIGQTNTLTIGDLNDAPTQHTMNIGEFEGTYKLYPRIVGVWQEGNVDIWNKKGAKVNIGAKLIDAGNYEIEMYTEPPLFIP